MANRYPKNANFNNIIVRNNGKGKVTSDSICTDTIYVKNLVVTDSLNIPVSNIDCLDSKDIETQIINKEVKRICKNSGNIIYNSEIEDVMINKNGKLEELSSNNTIGSISSIINEKSNDIDQAINNSFNKFTSISQTINFNGNQPPNTNNYILGSSNNINFVNEDSCFYIFEGIITANIKEQALSSFGKKEYKTINNDIVKLKRKKIYFSTYLIKNGLIKMQDSDVNSYETITLSNKVYTKFTLKKLQIGNKCYLAIETNNTTDNYISWKARIDIYKINVTSTLIKNGNQLDFFKLKNKPLNKLVELNSYSLESDYIFYKFHKQINFFNVPLYRLSIRDNKEILGTVFCCNNKNSIIDRDSEGNEILIEKDKILQREQKNIVFNGDQDSFYTVLTDDVSLIVRDIQNNKDNIKPYAYKHSYFSNSKYSTGQKINYINSKSFWKSEILTDKKIKQSNFFSITGIDYENDNLINVVYLTKSILQGLNEYYDYYLFSLNSDFIVNYVGDKIPEFKKQRFLYRLSEYKHYFIYKDCKKLSNTFTPIFLNNRSVYDLQFGKINIIEAKCVIIDIDKNSETFKKSKSMKLLIDCLIPTYQDIRSDIINKLTIDNLSPLEINRYLENSYINKNFITTTLININDDDIFIPNVNNFNKNLVRENSEKLFSDFDIKVGLGLRKINLSNLDSLNYASISKNLLDMENFYLKVEVKSSLEKTYQVNILFENNIFDIFSI